MLSGAITMFSKDPCLLPYLMVVHTLLDLAAVWMVLSLSVTAG
jgi:hypothetical protein